MFQDWEIQFRTFNVLDDRPNLGSGKVIGKVTACIQYDGLNKETKEATYRVGFSYCSPKEKQSNKQIGQYIAYRRMVSDKGSCYVHLVQEDIENPTMYGLTICIKNLIISEAKRKNIRWMKNLQHYQLV